MNTDTYDPEARQPRPLRNAVLIALVAFVLGVALVTWAFTQWEPARRLIAAKPLSPSGPLTMSGPSPLAAPTMAPPLGSQPSVPPPAASDAAITESRVAGLEARLAQIDTRADLASTNAARAEGLLIAFAARRAIDRGVSLGYLEGQLQARFADIQPRAVAAVVTATRSPVTLDVLRQQLDLIAPSLAGGGADESWGATLQRTLGTLFIVRKAETPSPAADQRLARARLALDGGQADVALAEIARLPSQKGATEWMKAARRYIEAQRALDILESSALTAGAPLSTGPVTQ